MIPEIEEKWKCKCCEESIQSNFVHQNRIEIQSCQSVCKVLDIRIRDIRLAQFLQYPEMQVSQWTITESSDYQSKEKPWCSCKQERDEVKLPGFSPDPSEEIEEDKGCMKHYEKVIKKSPDHNIVFNKGRQKSKRKQ